MSKARKKAKAKRKEFKERVQIEQVHAKARKEEKAERNRRFFNNEVQNRIPEDGYGFNTDSLSFDEIGLLSELHGRCFFTKLGEALNNKECDSNFEVAAGLLKQMKDMKEEKREEIFEMFKRNGGHCDCEIMKNVATRFYIDDTFYEEEYYI